MANIAITTNCNLRCKYCFADEFVGNKQSNEMPFENYLTAKKFILKSNQKSFGIIGGEPSTHSKYKEILIDCINEPAIERVVIYTNGLCVKNFINEYSSSKFDFLINCNSPEDIGAERYNLLQTNLDLLANTMHAANRITLGINLYHPNQDFNYIINLCKSIGKKEVRVSITIPSVEEKMETYFEKMKPLLIGFYDEVVNNGIQPRYDCNIVPSCIYTEEEMFKIATKLSHTGIHRERLIGERCMCSPVIDILPDLTAIRCFGMSDICKVKITDFKCLQDLNNFFLREIDFKLANVMKNTACDNCYKRKTLQCSGGCLVFRKSYIQEVK